MDAALKDLADQIDLATQRLLDDARTLTEADLRVASLLPGWTRAHVLAHLAAGAGALRNLLVGVKTGRDRPAYASEQAREDAIEAGAALTAAELTAELADSAMALRALARQLPDEAWLLPVRRHPVSFPAAEVLTRRLSEVELHHCDLATGYGPADWPAAFAELDLPEPMRTQRRERLAYPESALSGAPRTPPRAPAPWSPGRPLPGSWIGSADGRP